MIRFIDVYKEYDNGTKALKGVNMRIDDGEFVFLVGPSGSGKSTIIKLITGEIAMTQGKIMVNGYSMSNISPKQVPLMRRTLGIIFQDFRLIEKKTVYENLSFAMRAIGASKRNVSQVFNAETFIIGLCAGVIGIGITLLALIPANQFIHYLAGSSEINAILPAGAAVALILLSVLLTLLGGLIPSRKAAKSDPVTALRTE